ncbi:hypothetical protein CEUSTIGMA_g3250.t1 [Chlamydomonas eustigma]|uniref:Major facilitator superfamily (MFS) profile domain-containing protein n=1 Tax=Chlamydomonas eustigma TaxID=1157962 RepID=A0A250WY89_9CHLO|nr:hypothetical protein CEUSTIGMA_g3250.t1 [Chlamydomonas eustigma]|eukprot:GAX75807.1 hypothetical protein CEUSTIGMA_g3250.t1 [Chlamydomonas eustigma]
MRMLLVRIASFAALGGFLFGYDLGLIGGALLEIRGDLELTSTFTVSLIVGAFKFGAFFGTFFGGATMLLYGRRHAIAINSMFSALGPLIMAISSTAGGLMVGRFVGGFGIGACALVVPAYLAEMAPAHSRGAIVQFYEMMLCVGMLASMFMDWALEDAGWRWMVAIPSIPGAAQALALLVLPESPRWLVMQGRMEEAMATLRSIIQSDEKEHRASRMKEAEDELLQLSRSTERDNIAAMERRKELRQWSWKVFRGAGGSGRSDIIRSDSHYANNVPAVGSSLFAGSRSNRGHEEMLVREAAQSGYTYPYNGCMTAANTVDDYEVEGTDEEPLLSSSRPAISQQYTGTGSMRFTSLTIGSSKGMPMLDDHPAGEPPQARSSSCSTSGARVQSSELEIMMTPQLTKLTGNRSFVQPVAETLVAGKGADMRYHALAAAEQPAVVHTSCSRSRYVSSGCQQSPSCMSQPEAEVPSVSDPNDRHLELNGRSKEDDGAKGPCGICNLQKLRQMEAADGGIRDQIALPQQDGSAISLLARGGEVMAEKCRETECLRQTMEHEGHRCVNEAWPSHVTTSPPGSPWMISSGAAIVSPGKESSLAGTLLTMLLDIFLVARGEERRSFMIAIMLAFFNQATASTAIINFAPTLLIGVGGTAGISGESAVLLSTAVSVAKTVGVLIGLVIVDRVGRRPLLIWGAVGCTVSMVLLTLAAALGETSGASPVPLLAAMCAYILSFSVTWAGLYWVVVSEIFSMAAKSPASSAATSMLFLSGALTNMVFMSLVDLAGAYAFLVFATVAAVSGWFVWKFVPETKGHTLSEIQDILAMRCTTNNVIHKRSIESL